MRLVIAAGSRKTGEALKAVLLEKGAVLEGNDRAVVNYGVAMQQDAVVFNTITARSKYAEAALLFGAGIGPAVARDAHFRGAPGIWLRRDNQHTRGRDIRLEGPADYYSQYNASQREFRVWMLRGKSLGVYEKVKSPHLKAKRHYRELARQGVVVRSFHAGYAFQLVEQPVPALLEVAARALTVLGLNFAALDIIQTNGGYLVLEANTAPGVEGEARLCLRKLASRIVTWQQRGYHWKDELQKLKPQVVREPAPQRPAVPAPPPNRRGRQDRRRGDRRRQQG